MSEEAARGPRSVCSPRLRFGLVSLLTACLLPVAAAGWAAESGDPARDSAALRFRRIYVPEGTTNLPKGDDKYLPMDAAEFERLLGTIQRTAQGLPGQSAAGFDQAQYECRLKGQSLLQGNAVLDVSSAIASSTLLTLDRCSLAIDRARWVTSDGAPVVMGISNDGRLQVLAERAGQMKFEWSLAGQSDDAGGASFSIRLPPCSLSQLLIELPAELTPSVDRGVLTDNGLAEPEIRRWKLELGGWSGCCLRVAKKGAADAQRQALLADQTADYHLSLRGADATFEMNIDAHRQPLRKLTLDLEPSLQLLEVVAGEQPLPWNLAKKPRRKRQQAMLEIPPPLQEGALKLRVRAIAPLMTDETWKLPRLSVEEAVCRTSSVRLAVESPLCVAAVTPHGCRQTGAAPLTSPAGEQFDFEAYDPDGSVELTLTRRAADVQAITATATVIGQGKMRSRVAADFHTSEGPVFVLQADVLPYWAIDSVTSQPAEALDDWTVQPHGGSRRLSLRFARPLTSARPLRLIVSARRLYAGSGRGRDVKLNLDDVVPLRFAAPVESLRLVDLRTGSANELHVAGGDRPWRTDVKELTAAELDLFADPPGDDLLRDDPGTAGVEFMLTARKPAYSAEIRMDAVVAGGMLDENYTIVCSPAKNATIDRFVVHFTGHRDAPLTRSSIGLDEPRFSARRWTAAQESAAGLTADDEVWDVALANRRSSPIELHAHRKTKIGGALPLCLASLPDAAVQQASVVVRNLGPQALQFKTQRVTPLPIEAAPPGQIQTARAAYRYDPRQEAAPQDSPAIVLMCADSTTPAAWAWDCDICSQFAADGTGEHRIRYRIENADERQIRLKLPPPLTRRDVYDISINGSPAAAFSSAADDVLTIDLPASARSVELALRITTHGPALGTFHQLQPALPDIGLPVFARHWRVELPPGYATLGGNRGAEATAADSFDWRRRLFGCLGRSEDQRVFNPLRGGDWRGLLPRVHANPLPGNRPGVPNDVAGEAAGPAGWSQYSIALTGGNASVTVIHRPAVDTAGWLLFLAIVGLGVWPRTGRRTTLIVLAVVCGMCALLLPAALAAVFSCGLLGLAFCLLRALVRRRNADAAPPPAQASPEMPSTLSNVIPFAAPVLFAALFLSPGSAGGAEPSKEAAVHSVYIPVTEKQEPTGGKYLVPEAFFSDLYRRAGQHAEKPQGWMIVSAVYRAALAEDAALREPAVERLTVEYGIRVFATAERVRIPLRRDEVSLVPDQAALDDRPIQPEWDSDGSALLLDIAEPGEYRLELALRPSRAPSWDGRPENHAGGFDLAIPRVPTARLEITGPTGGPPVTVPSALGAVRWEEIPARWIAELGPAKRLTVRWHDAAAAEEPASVQLLQWLKVEPGCVLLNVRLKARALGGQLRRLQLKTDASLELLPEAGAAVQPIVTRTSDATQTIECRLPPPVGAEATLDLRFLCTGASSIGTLRAAQMEVVGAHPRRWLAVTVDRSLEYQLPAAGHALAGAQEAGAVSEFLSNWGAAQTPPDLAFHLNGNSAESSLTVRTRKPEAAGDVDTSWTFDVESAQVQFDAQLTAPVGNVFQYRMEVPPGLHVDSLAVIHRGVSVPSRWIAERDGRITVFLQSAVSGRHELQLRGQLPAAMKRRFQLPQFRLDDVHIQTSVVRLYQRPTVATEVLAPAGLTEVKRAVVDVGDAEARKLLRAFYVDPAGTGAVAVVLQPAVAPARPETAVEPRPAPPPQRHGKPHVAAADIRYACGSGGRCIGAAVFDVESPSAADYRLELPSGFELLRLAVDGVPVDAPRGPDGTWILPLAPHGPKSRVETLFAWRQTSAIGLAAWPEQITFHSPRLGDLPVEQTTWTIAAPRGMQAISAEADGNSVAAEQGGAPRSSELASRWREFTERDGNAISYAVSGPCDSITLNYRAEASGGWLPQVASVAGFLAAMGLIVWGLRRRALPGLFLHRPSLAGVVVGIAWWLWAWPSALGLAIVLAIVARKLLADWRPRRLTA